MVKYCEETDICRHKIILNYFRGTSNKCNEDDPCTGRNCDCCNNKENLKQRKRDYEKSINPSNAIEHPIVSTSELKGASECPPQTPLSPASTGDFQPSTAIPYGKIVSASSLYKKILESRKRKRENADPTKGPYHGPLESS